jgi:competence protein ComEC
MNKNQGIKYPVILKLVLPLILGVILGFYTDIFLGYPVIAGFLGLLLLIFFFNFNNNKESSFLFTSVAFVIFMSLGLFLSKVQDSSLNDNYFMNLSDGWENYLVKIEESPEEKENSIKCVVDVLQIDEDQCSGRSLIYLQKDSISKSLQYGDLLYFNGRFNPIRSNGNPKEFDYARYLRIHDIHHQAYVKSEKWKLLGNDGNALVKGVSSLRGYFSSLIKESGLSAKNSMVANALLLGQKEYLDKEVLRSYSSAGAMHVLAVSGLHVGIVMLILTSLMKPIKRFKYGKQFYLLIILGGIWFYALITGLSPSVMRAGVMFTFIVIGQELERDSTVYQSIMVSAFLLILFEPYIIFQVGFQLSYLAVLGIVYLQPKIENLIFVENKILHKAWQISAVSIAAQIATFPLGLYYFHQFPNFFLLSNLLVIPLAFFILILGISYLVLHQVPWVSDLLFWLFDGAISILNMGVEWVEKLPYSILWGISIEWYEVFLLYVTIVMSSVAFIQRKTTFLLASLSITVLLLGLNVYEKVQWESENVICLYNVNNEVAIDVFYGRQNTFYSSNELFQDAEKLLFHVKHNWFYRTGNESPNNWVDISSVDFINVGSKQLSLLNERKLKDEQLPKTAYVLLNEIDYLDRQYLDTLDENGSHLILASGVKSSVKNFIREKYPDLTVTDLKESGAMEIYF